MSYSKNGTKIFEMASGDISVWVDGSIHLKVNSAFKDPVELGESEALELGELLVRLAKEQR
jgi:hypothetical protein